MTKVSDSGSDMLSTDTAHLESHLGEEGELVLLEQCLAYMKEGGIGDALHQD